GRSGRRRSCRLSQAPVHRSVRVPGTNLWRCYAPLSVSCWPVSEGLAPTLRVPRGPHGSCRPSDMQNRPAWLDRSVASPPLRCAHRPVPRALRGERYTAMVIVGIDAHKRTHTAVVIDEAGRRLGGKTTRATTAA